MNIVQTFLPGLIQKYKPDVVVVNGENACDGKGITPKEGSVLFDLGVQVITGGNHTWDRPQSQDYFKSNPKVLRPHNYPRGAHGTGLHILETKKGKMAILNLQGRTFMSAIDCPFRCAEYTLAKIKNECKMVIIDFHAEASAEKAALGHFLDGKVTAILGTHTHIQTADNRILPKGTAFITDVGMTGPYDSVIGMKTVAAINRFLYQTPQKYEPAQDDVHLCGVILKIDADTGASLSIERIFLPEFEVPEVQAGI